MSEDNEHQETLTREDDADPIENPPGPANLARALEVAEELLQAIKQANPTPTGKQSVLPAAPCHGAPCSLPSGLPNKTKKKKRKNFVAWAGSATAKKKKKKKFLFRLLPPP